MHETKESRRLTKVQYDRQVGCLKSISKSPCSNKIASPFEHYIIRMDFNPRGKKNCLRTIRETIYAPCLTTRPCTVVRIALGRPFPNDETGSRVIFNNMPCGSWTMIKIK